MVRIAFASKSSQQKPKPWSRGLRTPTLWPTIPPPKRCPMRTKCTKAPIKRGTVCRYFAFATSRLLILIRCGASCEGTAQSSEDFGERNKEGWGEEEERQEGWKVPWKNAFETSIEICRLYSWWEGHQVCDTTLIVLWFYRKRKTQRQKLKGLSQNTTKDVFQATSIKVDSRVSKEVETTMNRMVLGKLSKVLRFDYTIACDYTWNSASSTYLRHRDVAMQF